MKIVAGPNFLKVTTTTRSVNGELLLNRKMMQPYDEWEPPLGLYVEIYAARINPDQEIKRYREQIAGIERDIEEMQELKKF